MSRPIRKRSLLREGTTRPAAAKNRLKFSWRSTNLGESTYTHYLSTYHLRFDDFTYGLAFSLATEQSPLSASHYAMR